MSVASAAETLRYRRGGERLWTLEVRSKPTVPSVVGFETWSSGGWRGCASNSHVMCGLENCGLHDVELDCFKIAMVLLLVEGMRVNQVFCALLNIELQKGREVSAEIILFR